MGLLDSVLGAAVGNALGRGGLGGALGGGGRGGGGLLRSPIVKALIFALAAKAVHEHLNRNRTEAGKTASSGGVGDVLGGILGGVGGGRGGGLGGLLAGLGGAGGLGALVEQFNRRGHGDAIKSWVDLGPNQPIPPQQLAEALGPENLAELERETGLAQPQLLDELSRELPEAIDQITPKGRLPTDDEVLPSN